MTAPLVTAPVDVADQDHQPLLLQSLVHAVGDQGRTVRTYTVCCDCTVVLDLEVVAYVAWPCAPLKRQIQEHQARLLPP